MRGSRWMLAIAVPLLVLSWGGHRAGAWHDEGHVYTTTAAMRALPDDVPAFFREGVRTVAHCALDPDLMRHDKLAQLKAAEYPHHYFDQEHLGDAPLPKTRAELIARCHELDVAVGRVGFLPYALVEATQRLTLAFAEHRANPDNAHVRMKCLVYAGRLAHYAADLHQPLHTTVHWDGRAEPPDYESPRTGIHVRIDALPTKLTYAELFAEPLSTPTAHDDVFALVKRELAASFALVDRAYALEADMPAHDEMSLDAAPVRRFTIERMRAAAGLIAALQLSAWRQSEDLSLPAWHERGIYDDGFDETKIPPQPQRDAE